MPCCRQPMRPCIGFCRISMPKTERCWLRLARLLWTDLSCQGVKLVGKRYAIAARHVELAFANRVLEFDAGQVYPGFSIAGRMEQELNAFLAVLRNVVNSHINKPA